MSENVGEVLKQARLQQGLSLEEVEEITKIRKRYLQAIENGRFQELPGNFYVRAFIKSYAEAVQLNPHEVLQLYKNFLPNHAPQPIIGKTLKRKSRYNSDKITKGAFLFFLVCFILLISMIIYYFLYISDNSQETNLLDDTPLTERTDDTNTSNTIIPAPSQTSTTDSQPQIPEEESELELEPEVRFVNTDQVNYIYNITNTETLKVEMKLIGAECWVEVKKDNKDGEKIESKMFYQDDEHVWETDHSLWLRLGAPNAVTIHVNGHPIENIESTSPVNVQLNLVKPQSEEQKGSI